MGKQKRQFQSIFTTRTGITRERKTSLQNVMKALILNPLSLQFREPLDWQRQGLINYDAIIEKPMDLRTVKENLRNELYHSVEDCLDDIELIFQNSFCYNMGNSWIEDLTEKCEKAFLKLVRNYFPELGTKNNSENKKALKRNKIEKKQNSFETMQTDKKNSPQNAQGKVKLQDPNEQTLATIIPPNKDETKNQEELSQLRNQLFDLIREASQKTLQIFYLIIKNQDTSIISTGRNGNCNIDVKNLSEQFVTRLIDFLKSEKERQKHDALKAQTIKRKRKVVHEKSRYEI